MAAGIALLQALPPGSHVLFPDDVYYGFRAAAGEVLPDWGSGRTSWPWGTSRPSRRRSVRRPGWSGWRRRPTPAQRGRSGGRRRPRPPGRRPWRVDNTFATPVLQRPIEHGGRRRPPFDDQIPRRPQRRPGGRPRLRPPRRIFRAAGGTSATSWGRCLALQLVARAARPAAPSPAGWRRRARSDRGRARLEAHPEVSAVHYPGFLATRHVLAKRQMAGFGGMLSFGVAAARTRR